MTMLLVVSIVCFPVIYVWLIIAMLSNTMHSRRYERTINVPWGKAIAAHDWDKCRIFGQAATEAIADYDDVWKPWKWRELWCKQYVPPEYLE